MIARLWLSAILLLSACQTTPTEFSSVTGPEGHGGGTPTKATTDDTVVGELPKVPSSPQVADLTPGERPDLDTVEAGLWMTVEKAERSIFTAGNRITDPELNDYVRDVTCRVAGPYCDDIRVYVLRVPDFNAAMYPNGTMVVWSGLLLRAENEAQLATVIGHEIGHYIRRHGTQRFKDAGNKADFLAFFQIGAAVAGVPALGNLAEIVTLASLFSFSRDNEREADAIGVRWMASAGYDPAEAPTIWRNLIRELEATDEGIDQSIFFSSHPPPSERSETLTAFSRYLHEHGHLPTNTGGNRYQDIVGPWRVKFLADEVQTKEPDDALALISVLKDGKFSESELLFYEGEVYRQRNEDGDLQKAASLYEEAIQLGDVPAEIHRSLGLCLRKLGRLDEAIGQFNAYLQKYPDAPDAEMIRFTMKKLEYER